MAVRPVVICLVTPASPLFSAIDLALVGLPAFCIVSAPPPGQTTLVWRLELSLVSCQMFACPPCQDCTAIGSVLPFLSAPLSSCARGLLILRHPPFSSGVWVGSNWPFACAQVAGDSCACHWELGSLHCDPPWRSVSVACQLSFSRPPPLGDILLGGDVEKNPGPVGCPNATDRLPTPLEFGPPDGLTVDPPWRPCPLVFELSFSRLSPLVNILLGVMWRGTLAQRALSLPPWVVPVPWKLRMLLVGWEVQLVWSWSTPLLSGSVMLPLIAPTFPNLIIFLWIVFGYPPFVRFWSAPCLKLMALLS